MSPSNKEMQLRKNCELYVYVLVSLDKEIPEEIVECATSYDYPIDCVSKLAQELEGLDSDTFDRIVNDTNSQEARDLSNWWEMHKEADRLHQALSADR